jgi:hypothetical protein
VDPAAFYNVVADDVCDGGNPGRTCRNGFSRQPVDGHDVVPLKAVSQLHATTLVVLALPRGGIPVA